MNNIEQIIADRDKEKADRIAATASPEQAAAAIAWLRERLTEQLQEPVTDFRRAELEGARDILDLHPPAPLEGTDQQVWECRAKCDGESWTCYGDGQDIVEAPCEHVKLLARPYAGRADFPEVLRGGE